MTRLKPGSLCAMLHLGRKYQCDIIYDGFLAHLRQGGFPAKSPNDSPVRLCGEALNAILIGRDRMRAKVPINHQTHCFQHSRGLGVRLATCRSANVYSLSGSMPPLLRER